MRVSMLGVFITNEHEQRIPELLYMTTHFNYIVF